MPPTHKTKHLSFVLKSLFAGDPLCPKEEEGRIYTPVASRSYPGREYRVTTSHGRVCVVEKGDGPPILLVHGLGAHIGRWTQTIEFLSKQYRVLAYDHPGFGKSDKTQKKYTIELFTDVLAEVIKTLDLKDLTLIGHSMGGGVVLNYLSRKPKAVRRAVVLAPAGINLPQHSWIQPLARRLLTTPLAHVLLARSIDQCVSERTEAVLDMIYHARELPQDPEWLLIRRTLVQTTHDLMSFSLYDRLSMIEVPLQVIWGREDRLMSKSLAFVIKEHVPRARVDLIAGCGHYPMLERPQELHEKLEEFLGSTC